MLSWFRRKHLAPPAPSDAPSRPDLSRIAVGDLLIDLEWPKHWNHGYEESGALVVWQDHFAVRTSGLTIVGKDPAARDLGVRHLGEDAAAKGRPLVTVSDTHAYYGYSEAGADEDGPLTNEFWVAGFGNRQLVLTLSYSDSDRPRLDLPAIRSAVEHAIRSASLTYPELPRAGNEMQIFNLAASQRPWFEHHRADMRRRVQRELGYDADGLIPLDVLDEYWARFIASPPASNDAVNAILNGVGVLFGDHLVQAKQFEWIILSDSYGVTLAVVALRGTANVNTDPMNYVAKRWDSKEPRFLVHGLRALCDFVDETARKWR